MDATPVLLRSAGPWRFHDPAAKLLARGALPGAFGYDLAAHSLRCARATGLPLIELLPAALPTSWMVNNRAPSPVFRRWLTPPLLGVWSALLDQLTGDTPGDPMEVRYTLEALCIEGHGLAAVSKVLALLVPEVVPLLDDAAVWLLTGSVSRPETADEPAAGPEHFLPSLAVFERSVQASEPALIALARGYTLAPLDAAQVLDRLTWFDSWGWRHGAASHERAGWAWLADAEREGVVRVPAGGPARVPTARLDLASVPADHWTAEARQALDTAST